MSELLFEGKEKDIYSSDDPDQVVIHYKDVATAFGGIKRAVIKDKGIYTSRISAAVFESLEKGGVPTHYIKSVGERDLLCRKIDLIPLQIVVRNRLAGTTAKMLGVKNGTRIPNTVFELRYNNDALGDPMINADHAVALGIVTYADMDTMMSHAAKANEILSGMFKEVGIELVDFKMECGRLKDGRIIVSDEISPDNCRLWDIESGEILDKDRFRHDMSDVCKSYRTVMERVIK